MKIILITITSFILNINLAISTENKLECQNIIKYSEHKGQTFLSFIQNTVKPTLDQYALEGYVLKGEEAVKHALENVSSKVRRKAIRGAGGIDNLLYIANQLKGTQTTLYELPELIADIDRKTNYYKLSTFFGLVSCGGAVIEFAPKHLAYNIHYGTGDQKKDKQTGRSFGEGLARNADDASDKNYLKDLESFLNEKSNTTAAFYSTLIKSLANNDTTDYSQISEFGQTLLTDFLAVYTAEQVRNLMDNDIHLHWDAALLEVTLLGIFHAGQDEVKMFYKDPLTEKLNFTSNVSNQSPGCSQEERKQRNARIYDYWQFSTSTNPEHCRRSGINITKHSFRTLGKLISEYERSHNPELVHNVERHFKNLRYNKNIFKQLSHFFINNNAPASLNSEKVEHLSSDLVKFLIQVKKDAQEITKYIENK